MVKLQSEMALGTGRADHVAAETTSAAAVVPVSVATASTTASQADPQKVDDVADPTLDATGGTVASTCTCSTPTTTRISTAATVHSTRHTVDSRTVGTSEPTTAIRSLKQRTKQILVECRISY